MYARVIAYVMIVAILFFVAFGVQQILEGCWRCGVGILILVITNVLSLWLSSSILSMRKKDDD